jgi:hypothetical protein
VLPQFHDIHEPLAKRLRTVTPASCRQSEPRLSKLFICRQGWRRYILQEAFFAFPTNVKSSHPTGKKVMSQSGVKEAAKTILRYSNDFVFRFLKWRCPEVRTGVTKIDNLKKWKEM